jgi:hypothetical protein
MRNGVPMSFNKMVITHNSGNLVKYKAKEINERRRQAQAFLRRKADQKKQPVKEERHNG